MFITIPRAPLTALALLERAGYPAYLVGGGLRDALRGEVPHDWDVTTAARPDAMIKIFKRAGYRTVLTGQRHGTVTLLVEHIPVECTTYRIDGDYADARHPDRVDFADHIEEDLSRRDFTINALACRLPHIADLPLEAVTKDCTVALDEMELIDLFGGQSDLANGVLRCVGDPLKRFSEDALRMLRAVRFCARLGMTVDPPTEAALAALSDVISRISVERIASELLRLLAVPRPIAPALALCARSGLLSHILPEMTAGAYTEHNDPLFALFDKVDTLPPDAPLRIALLLAQAGEGAARSACRRLKLSNELTGDVVSLVASLSLPLPETDADLRRYMARIGNQSERALLLRATLAPNASTSAAILALIDRCAAIRARGDCLTVAELAVDGRDLLTHTSLRGRAVGDALARLLDAVLEDPTLNRTDALLDLTKEKN